MGRKTEVKVAVVDDKQHDRTKLKKILIRLESDFKNVSFIIALYQDGISFLNSKEAYDLVLLDYEMPDKNGIYIAEKLEQRAKRPRVLFVSGYDELTKPLQKASHLRVVHGFIFKSDTEEEFRFQMKKVLNVILNIYMIEIDYYYVKPEPEIKKKREARIYYTKKLNARKISHILSPKKKNVIAIYTENEELMVSSTMKEFFGKLPNGEFEYSDRGVIVNLGFVHSIGKKIIYLTNDEELPLSASCKKDFQNSYDNYLLERFDEE